MEKIKVVVVDDTEDTRKNIKQLLSFEKNIEVIGEAENGEEAVFIVKEAKPDIVLMDINMPVVDGITATQQISCEVPETVVIIMSVQGESEYLKKAMSAGAREFLVKPFSGEDLIKTIYKAYEFENKRKERISPKIPHEEVSTKIITVFGTKGGVGRTTAACNIAVGLARKTKKKVAIVDLDLLFGDVSIMLNLTLKNTISDLVKDINQINNVSIEEYLVTHFSGVKVLPAPAKPEYAEYITNTHIEKIIKSLSGKFHYIVIDTASNFHETTLVALDMSDKIFMMSTLDIPTIKNVKAGLDVMDSLRYPKEKISIILNKASEQFGIKYKDFENTIKWNISYYLPDDPQTVITSANKGFPFVMTKTESKIAKSIFEIVDDISKDNNANNKETGLLKKMLGIH